MDIIPSHVSTRKPFMAMAAVYFMGTFNDNFYKQAALILAVAALMPEKQGYAVIVFTLPFIIFAAPAGWLSDRFAKRRVVIAAKWIELLAMLFGAVGICTENWPLIFIMLGLIGTQASIFSPAINGSIPELFPEKKIVKINGILRMVVTTAILTGIAFAGFALDIKGKSFFGIDNGRLLVAAIVVGMAILGVIISYGVFSKPSSSPQKKFPWTGSVDTVKALHEAGKDRLLLIIIAADVFIWFLGSLQILLINPLGLNEFEFSKSMTSALIVAQLLGIGIGGITSAGFAKGKHWFMILIPAGFLMSLFMGMVTAVPHLPETIMTPALFTLMGFIGLFMGLFMIPLESFIQIRPSSDKKGTVWASANCVVFGGIMLSGPVSNLLNADILPSLSFGILGTFSFIITVILLIIFKRSKAL